MVRSWLITGVCALALLPGCRHATGVRTEPSPPERVAGKPSPASPRTELPSLLETACATLPPPAASTQVSEPAPKVSPVSSSKPEVSRSAQDPLFDGLRDELARRRCTVEQSQESAPGHAADYRWLVGELQYLEVRQAWRVRYATIEEEDRYGGSVVLTDTGPMFGYLNGQLVRVEGHFVNPDSREPSPAYQVHRLQLLVRP